MKTSKSFMVFLISMLLITLLSCKNKSRDENNENGANGAVSIDTQNHIQEDAEKIATFRIVTNHISIKNYCKADSIIWYPEKLGLKLPFIMKGRYVPGSNEGTGIGHFRSVDEDFFESMGIDLIQGRNFDEKYDNNLKNWLVIISNAAYHKYWRDKDPIGQQIIIGPPKFPDMKRISAIVGVVSDVDDIRQGENSTPVFYILRNQIPDRWATEVATANEEQRKKHWSVSLRNKNDWPSQILVSKFLGEIDNLVLVGDIAIPKDVSISETGLAGSLRAIISFPNHIMEREYWVSREVVYIQGFIRVVEGGTKLSFISVKN